MKNLRLLTLLGLCLLVAPHAQATSIGVAIGVGPGYVGPAPVCPYGYYDYYPYACAPYGYYGPSWFSGGVFIGAGPWFHGYHAGPGFYAGRGYYGHIPAVPAHPAFRGGSIVVTPAATLTVEACTATRMKVVAVSMVVDAGRLQHQFELSRPTAFAVGRSVLVVGKVIAGSPL